MNLHPDAGNARTLRDACENVIYPSDPDYQEALNDASDNDLLRDAMYLMAIELLKYMSGCWQCPATRTCACIDKHECPEHLCRYWLSEAESRESREVPSW